MVRKEGMEGDKGRGKEGKGRKRRQRRVTVRGKGAVLDAKGGETRKGRLCIAAIAAPDCTLVARSFSIFFSSPLTCRRLRNRSFSRCRSSSSIRLEALNHALCREGDAMLSSTCMAFWQNLP